MELSREVNWVLALAYFVDRIGKFLMNSRSLSNVDYFDKNSIILDDYVINTEFRSDFPK